MPQRLWFPLTDVLPVAEHAVACDRHRITAAQVLAGTTLQPALIWTGTATHDILTSNGLPAWCTEHGGIHGAPARAWRHTATGRCGTARRPGHDTAYLPLGDPQLPDTVISTLRRAHQSGQHWVNLDINTDDGHLLTPHHLHLSASRDDLVPPGTTWSPATVTCADVGWAVYPALTADGYTTDLGFEIIRFHRATVERLAADLDAIHASPDRSSDPMPGEYPHLQFSGDTVIVLEGHDDGLQESLREVDRVHPDASGLYAIGAHTWTWRRTRNS